jgi:hypothetical protein
LGECGDSTHPPSTTRSTKETSTLGSCMRALQKEGFMRSAHYRPSAFEGVPKHACSATDAADSRQTVEAVKSCIRICTLLLVSEVNGVVAFRGTRAAGRRSAWFRYLAVTTAHCLCHRRPESRLPYCSRRTPKRCLGYTAPASGRVYRRNTTGWYELAKALNHSYASV